MAEPERTLLDDIHLYREHIRLMEPEETFPVPVGILRTILDAAEKFTIPSNERIANLAEELRTSARAKSMASKLFADMKSGRQADKDDHPGIEGGYDYTKPEDLPEWEAARLLEQCHVLVTSGKVEQ